MEASIVKCAEIHLSKTDKIMRRIIRDSGPLVLNKTPPSYFHALIHAIINQQLSVKAAATIENRLLERQGGQVFNASKLNKIAESALRQCGLSQNKIRYVKTLAAAVVNKELNFRRLLCQDDDSIRKQLVSYPGIGQWSADIFMMRGLGREDVLPIGDLIIRKSIQFHYAIPSNAHYDDYFAIAEQWRPYRTIASYHLWKAFHQS